MTVSPSTVTLAAGAQSSVAVTLSGSVPPAGEYEGVIVVSGAGSTLNVPYQFLVPSGIPADIIPTLNFAYPVPVGSTGWELAFRLLDTYGVPIYGVPAVFTAVAGGGSVTNSAGAPNPTTTLLYGEAAVNANVGSQPGEQIVNGAARGLTYAFDTFACAPPAIAAGGVVDGVSFTAGQGLAPGSYISIFGSALTDSNATYSTAYLPVSLASVFVSFIDGAVSAPGHIRFVSPSQINVQIPWEFQGHSTVQMFVSMDYVYSNTYTLKLAQYSPGIFAVEDANAGSSVVTSANPAHRGDTLELYVNGLGPVTIQPPSGEPTPATLPLSYTSALPTVTIGGANAPVSFSGLAPGYVGLYQVNAVVPSNAPTGNQPLVISIGGISSPPLTLAVQ